MKGRDHLINRENLNRMEFAYLAVEQGGLCGNCEAPLTFLTPRSVRDEHIEPLWCGGTNELSNRQLWCLTCAKAKDKREAPKRAKARRLNGETGQKKRRDERKAKGKRPLIQSNPKLPSRPLRSGRGFGRSTPNVKQLDEL
jgi:hypothetical protein